MIESTLFYSDLRWRQLCRARPTVLGVFSYRYDAELVPDLITHLQTIVDGFVSFDDTKAQELFSNEPARRRLLIERARELGATWVLAVDPDERFERALSTRIRLLTESPRRIVWQFKLREMYSTDSYRVDGIWGLKEQGRLFPVFDGPLCSERKLHGSWCNPTNKYRIAYTGLNLYHLKMIAPDRRVARRELYNHLDPNEMHQVGGYDYLTDEEGARFDTIPGDRDFFPAHDERNLVLPQVPDVRQGMSAGEHPSAPPLRIDDSLGLSVIRSSQLEQFTIYPGPAVDREMAVIVVGLHAPKSLLPAVQSLLQQEPQPEIIVVNTGGGDAGSVLRSVIGRFTLVEVKEPLFVGAARNIGIKVASAPFIAFLAGDCRAQKGWVADRLQLHANGAAAVSSAVICSAPNNTLAQAAHLLTYCRRMPGLPENELAQYGTSYDRTLFEKYGLFSESLRIAEDTEFHDRLRPPDTIHHGDGIRTEHADPTSVSGLVVDQFSRGRRARYLYEYFTGDCSLLQVLVGSYQRAATAIRLSAKSLRSSRYPLTRIASWFIIPFAALVYLAGSVSSYFRVLQSHRVASLAGEKMALGDREGARRLLNKAIELQPNFARHYQMRGEILVGCGEVHAAADDLFRAADMDHARLRSDFVARTSSPINLTSPPSTKLTIVVLSYGSPGRIMEICTALAPQLQGRKNTKLVIVSAHVLGDKSNLSRRVREICRSNPDFLTHGEFRSRCGSASLGAVEFEPDWVVATTDDFLPSFDWLQRLDCCLEVRPEVDLFNGSCVTAPIVAKPGIVAEMVRTTNLFPNHDGDDAAIQFDSAMCFACRASLYDACGGLLGTDNELRGYLALRESVLKAGGVAHEATSWLTRFRCDLSLRRLIGLSWFDGFQSAKVDALNSNGLSPLPFLASFTSMVREATAHSASKLAYVPRTSAKRYVWWLLLFAMRAAKQIGWRHGRQTQP